MQQQGKAHRVSCLEQVCVQATLQVCTPLHPCPSSAETGVTSRVTLVQRSEKLDFAMLEAATDHLFIALSKCKDMRGRQLVLASFRFGVAEYGRMFGNRLGFCPAPGIVTSPHGNHLLHHCKISAGDSGGALLLKDGKLVGLHMEVADVVRERLERTELDLKGRLSEVKESVAATAVLSGGFGQGAVALLIKAFVT